MSSGLLSTTQWLAAECLAPTVSTVSNILLDRGPSRSCMEWAGCSTSWISPFHRDGCSVVLSAVCWAAAVVLYTTAAGQRISLPETMSERSKEETGLMRDGELYRGFSFPKVTEEAVEGLEVVNDVCRCVPCVHIFML